MTQAEFNELPRLMRSADVTRVLGIDKRAVRKMRLAEPKLAGRVPGGKEFRFYKCYIAEMAHLEDRT